MKAAGVTFRNEPKDSGRNRQDILRELMPKTNTIRLWLRPGERIELIELL